MRELGCSVCMFLGPRSAKKLGLMLIFFMSYHEQPHLRNRHFSSKYIVTWGFHRSTGSLPVRRIRNILDT
jgi:hypothetical protein